MSVAEADVHTATPSLSNAAATWAGWAVTAVTSKFYRSQSDTVKSITPVASKTLSKPGSLGTVTTVTYAMEIKHSCESSAQITRIQDIWTISRYIILLLLK
jgi:SCY1-like protein 1